jgi:hypothetical protein
MPDRYVIEVHDEYSNLDYARYATAIRAIREAQKLTASFQCVCVVDMVEMRTIFEYRLP